MKILSAELTRKLDQETIKSENINSEILMERAARAFTGWFENRFLSHLAVYIFCGPGNNGGDGLAIARLLHQNKYTVSVYSLTTKSDPAPDFKLNLKRLSTITTVNPVHSASDFPEIPKDAIVIDALFGTGLNRPVTGIFASLIQHINANSTCTVSVDMPSGLFTDEQTPPDGEIIQAEYTISFELPKLAFFLPQHAQFIGNWVLLVPIGSDAKFIHKAKTNYSCITQNTIKSLIKPRKPFSHKGTFGHALLLAGSYGKMGAAILATKACLRSGAGLVSTHIPALGYDVLQATAPEAMASVDKNRKYLSQLPEMDNYNVIGVGPGIGKHPATKTLIGQLLATTNIPLVLDADALNIIAENEKLKNAIPANSILTPHPKEFERLAGKAKNDFNRLELLQQFCQQYACYVVLKGNYTCICTPAGECYFNTTGNPGMATGGTGDVLTGIITALAAQYYSPLEACLVGVYMHGLAGDLAAVAKGEVSLIASDVIAYLGKAFKQFQ